MEYIKSFESHSNNTTLIIVDVQKSFRKFFTEIYVHKLKEYCKQFTNVYQIFDNHIDGPNVDKDFLYDKNPDVTVNGDLYTFPNQTDLIEKRYNYDVDADFYKKILDRKTYKTIKEKEQKKQLKRGDIFRTTENTHIVYIGNNHQWYHIPKKLYSLFTKLKGQEVIVTGGSQNECLTDIVVAGESLGVIMKQDHRYIYSANHCPIK